MVDIDLSGSGGQEEDLKKYEGDKGLVQRWIKEIELVKSSRSQRSFEKNGETIIKKYKNASSVDTTSSTVGVGRVLFNVLWANIQVLKPSLFSRMPKTVVERLISESDDIGRMACTLAERATTFQLDTQHDRVVYAIKAAVEDRLLPGRGQISMRFACEFDEQKDEHGEPMVDAAGEPIRQVKPNTEQVIIEPLNWLDYGHTAARHPYEIRAQWKRTYMTRSELIRRFGKQKGEACKLEYNGTGEKNMSKSEEEFLKQAIVYEIEDKDTKTRLWISKGYTDGPLDIQNDVLGLQNFFSYPIPLLATTTSDSMYPTPDYKIYEKLDDELNNVTKRIMSIVDCIRFVGVTSAQFNKDIKQMLQLEDGELWPIKNWAGWQEKGGFGKAVDWMPFENCVSALPALQTYQANLITFIRSISRIPDVLMGETDPNDPVYTQQMKGKALVLNMRDPQEDVQTFCKQIVQNVAEIIFEPGLFSDETILLMVGYQQMKPEDQALVPPALQLLRDDRLRTFRVGIATDSTIMLDEAEAKAGWAEYMNAISTLTTQLQQVVQFRPEMLTPMIEAAKGYARAFRTGKNIESAWEKTLNDIVSNDAAAKQQPPPPNIDMMRLQQDGQLRTRELDIRTITAQAEAQFKGIDGQVKQFMAEFTQWIDTQKLELEKGVQALNQQEKLIEEQRLKTEDANGAKRGSAGHGGITLQLKTDHPIGVTHQRPKRKKMMMVRTPEGLQGVSEDIPDEGGDGSVGIDGVTPPPQRQVFKASRGADGSMIGEVADE